MPLTPIQQNQIFLSYYHFHLLWTSTWMRNSFQNISGSQKPNNLRSAVPAYFYLLHFFLFSEKHNTLNIGTRKLALTKEPVAPDIHLNCAYSIWQYPPPPPPLTFARAQQPEWHTECRSLLSVLSVLSLWTTKLPKRLSWSRTVWFCCLCAKKFDQFLFPQVMTTVKYSTAPPCPETKWSLTQRVTSSILLFDKRGGRFRNRSALCHTSLLQLLRAASKEGLITEWFPHGSRSESLSSCSSAFLCQYAFTRSSGGAMIT